jgi:hypothetical protein
MSFDNRQHWEDYSRLMQAIDDAPTQVPCTNFPDAYFIDDSNQVGQQKMAVNACATCPLMKECADYGIKWEIYGVWGGLTPQQRKLLRRKRVA